MVWRWKNGDNYYVARANALENNVSLYYTQDGARKTIEYKDAPVPYETPLSTPNMLSAAVST